MTTPPPAPGSSPGQAVPARVVPQTVVEAIDGFRRAILGMGMQGRHEAHAVLVAAIADAIEEARRDTAEKAYVHGVLDYERS
jgi:hypothetical protein